MSNMYPILYDQKEIDRLKIQAVGLYDSRLDDVICRSSRILDIGCGPGTLFKRVLQLNPKCEYRGLDLSDKAILEAQQNFGAEKFLVRDLTKDLSDLGQFDLIICRLVLWSIPNVNEKFIERLQENLKPNGIFHAFEPDDNNLVFYPPKKNLEEIISAWQAAALKNGQDPFIGRKLYSLLVNSGFKNVEVFPHIFSAGGTQPENYRTMSKNLKNIFASRSADFLKIESKVWQAGLAEFETFEAQDIIIETHYSIFGTKA